MNRIDNLKIKLFADGADFDGMVAMRKNPLIKGLYHESDADAEGRRDRL